MEIRLYNSKSKKKEIFHPINDENVTMYVCGPTVYGSHHIGNARPAVVFDLLAKLLRNKYKNLTYARNITDVDDKIIEASKRNKKDINEITSDVTKVFHENCKSLNCLLPTKEPKATDHIDEMIKMTESLIKKKFAYEVTGHVYFSVSSF
mgnify:CR=1 FL=1